MMNSCLSSYVSVLYDFEHAVIDSKVWPLSPHLFQFLYNSGHVGIVCEVSSLFPHRSLLLFFSVHIDVDAAVSHALNSH